MANISVDNIDRCQGRLTGTFDVDHEQVRYGDVVMAVVVVNVGQLGFKKVRGEEVGTYVLEAQDIAIVADETLQNQLYHHLLPHLQPPVQEPAEDEAPPWVGYATAEFEDKVIGGSGTCPIPPSEYDPWNDTVVTTEQLDSVEAHDAEDGEVFSPADESRERARLVGAARDPILKRFLNGD